MRSQLSDLQAQYEAFIQTDEYRWAQIEADQIELNAEMQRQWDIEEEAHHRETHEYDGDLADEQDRLNGVADCSDPNFSGD